MWPEEGVILELRVSGLVCWAVLTGIAINDR